MSAPAHYSGAMSDEAVTSHYTQPDLLSAIEAAIAKAGKSPETVTIDDLAPADEFHIGGRVATEHLFDQLGLTATDHVLDIGCGIGGPSRAVIGRVAQVTGVDLTADYVETGRAINEWFGLSDRIDLRVGNALALDLADSSVDGGYLIHVGMNIADKSELLGEVARVLRPGGRFGVYDIMAPSGTADSTGATGGTSGADSTDEFAFPVPWAADATTSHVVAPEVYRRVATDAGLVVVAENDRTDNAKEFFAQAATRPPSPIGLQLVMGPTVGEKVKNMVANLTAGRIAPVEMILQRPDAG